MYLCIYVSMYLCFEISGSQLCFVWFQCGRRPEFRRVPAGLASRRFIAVSSRLKFRRSIMKRDLAGPKPLVDPGPQPRRAGPEEENTPTAEAPNPNDTYQIGQSVRYWSTTHSQWVYGNVKAVLAPSGKMIISCKPSGPAVEKNDDRLQPWDRGPDDEPPHDDPPPGFPVSEPPAKKFQIMQPSEVEFAGKWRLVTPSSGYEPDGKSRVRWRLGNTDWAWLGENPPSKGDVHDLIKKN